MRAVLSGILIALMANGCAGDVGESTGPHGGAIDQYIEGLPLLPVDPPAIVQGAASTQTHDGDYQCSTQNLQETRDYDQIVAFAANSDSLWPGRIKKVADNPNEDQDLIVVDVATGAKQRIRLGHAPFVFVELIFAADDNAVFAMFDLRRVARFSLDGSLRETGETEATAARSLSRMLTSIDVFM